MYKCCMQGITLVLCTSITFLVKFCHPVPRARLRLPLWLMCAEGRNFLPIVNLWATVWDLVCFCGAGGFRCLGLLELGPFVQPKSMKCLKSNSKIVSTCGRPRISFFLDSFSLSNRYLVSIYCVAVVVVDLGTILLKKSYKDLALVECRFQE